MVKLFDRKGCMKARDGSSIARRFLVLIVMGILASPLSPAQWVQQTSGTPENLVDVVMLDSMKALAIGDRNGILLTTNAGATWINESAVVSATYEWNRLSFHDSLNGTIVGDHRIVTTTDGGSNWTLRTAPSTLKCLSVLNTGSTYMYVGADSGWMYSTSDTGKTWTSAKISSWPIRSIFEYQEPTLWGAPVYYALTPRSLCSKPVYPSPEWNETILSNFHGLGSEAYNAQFCNGGGAGFIVGVFGDLWSEPGVLRKSMLDTVWSVMQLTSLQPGIFSGISAPSSSIVYVCGSSGMIYKTSNGGDTWMRPNSSTTHNLNALYFWNENRGFAVGDSGTILFTENGGGVAGVSDVPENFPTGFSLEQNYPNPFNPVTVISYRLKVKSLVTVAVYDLLGREAATLVNEEQTVGNHSVRWDATSYSSGVYFYRLKAEGVVETKKMVLIR
jgi:photosystem II stability/assembly factor-like uncharacterized protein